MASKKKAPWWLLRNSGGRADGMWTLLVMAFTATTLSYLVSMLSVIQIGDFTLAFQSFEATGYAAVVLVPLIAAYFGRRYTTATNETAKSQALIYAQVAKRRLNAPAMTGTTVNSTIKIDGESAVGTLHDELEAEMNKDLEDPSDEV